MNNSCRSSILQCGNRQLDLGEPCVMGVLNITPDSFSDGGRFLTVDAAVAHGEEMAAAGAAIIDVGGESTRPGAASVSSDEEMHRTIPVIEALAGRISVPVSIDTSKAVVMAEAIAAGATMINDVRALHGEGAMAVAAESNVAVCLMHMQGLPETMQAAPSYHDIVVDIKTFFADRLAACVAAGIDAGRVCIDPGFGFGKTLDHNLALLKHLDLLGEFGRPVMVGLSRKSMIGMLLDRPVEKRFAGSLALATLAVWQGAAIVRAHDVSATVDAIRLCQAVKEAGT